MKIVNQSNIIKKNLYELEKRLGRGKEFHIWFNDKNKSMKKVIGTYKS